MHGALETFSPCPMPYAPFPMPHALCPMPHININKSYKHYYLFI
ncbi:protein phosphatase 2 (formerly 2A), regulatory subunit B'', alpha [Tolypothrix sp. PCC 7601]|nr:protein phosphatase 2 (formerly 2A), regulatory subunit B'', alpha [Tolypothrix sp. PCC 7601]